MLWLINSRQYCLTLNTSLIRKSLGVVLRNKRLIDWLSCPAALYQALALVTHWLPLHDFRSLSITLAKSTLTTLTTMTTLTDQWPLRRHRPWSCPKECSKLWRGGIFDLLWCFLQTMSPCVPKQLYFEWPISNPRTVVWTRGSLV